MPALTKRSLATRLARLEKKLGVDISLCDDDIEEEDALKKEVEEKEEQTEVKNIRSLKDVLEMHVSGPPGVDLSAYG